MQICTRPRCQPETCTSGHIQLCNRCTEGNKDSSHPALRLAQSHDPKPHFSSSNPAIHIGGAALKKKKKENTPPALRGPGRQYSKQPNAFSSPNVIVKVSLEAAFLPILRQGLGGHEPPKILSQVASAPPAAPPASPRCLKPFTASKCPLQPSMPPPFGPRLMPPDFGVSPPSSALSIFPQEAPAAAMGRGANKAGSSRRGGETPPGTPEEERGHRPYLALRRLPGMLRPTRAREKRTRWREKLARFPGNGAARTGAAGPGTRVYRRRTEPGAQRPRPRSSCAGTGDFPRPPRPARSADARWVQPGPAPLRRREATPLGSENK